jgi:hypothetical protein
MKIERPNWYIDYDFYSRDHFDKWFNENVEPINEMLSKGIEVYNWEEVWHPKLDAYDDKPTSKALLINIEPIKQETAEDMLRRILDDPDNNIKPIYYDKAKKLLEEE